MFHGGEGKKPKEKNDDILSDLWRWATKKSKLGIGFLEEVYISYREKQRWKEAILPTKRVLHKNGLDGG